MIKISAAESQIMQALWRGRPLTPEEIIAEVGPANGWAAGTVRTLITRLLRKKAIKGGKEASGYYYRPLLDRGDYVQAESESLIDRLFAGELAPMVAHFAKNRPLTPKDVQALEALIAELKGADEAS